MHTIGVNDDELADRFDRAAAIASRVPEGLREAAFLRALDALGVAAPKEEAPGRIEAPPFVTAHPKDEGVSDPVAAFGGLQRDQAAEVDSESGSLAQSLALLLVARRELGIDGLTASQISRILTEKFRHKYTRQAITQSFNKAGRLVDRNSSGPAVVYRLMRAGEDWLSSSPDQRPLSSTKRPARTSGAPRATKSTTTPKPDSAESASENRSPRPTSRRRSATTSRREGPKAALEKLIDEGFFASSQSIATIKEHFSTNLARSYATGDLAPTLTRLLREKRLVRTKTEGGVYEYKAP